MSPFWKNSFPLRLVRTGSDSDWRIQKRLFEKSLKSVKRTNLIASGESRRVLAKSYPTL